eukprot:TRINITY_DN30238_c0_g1_i1.p1 TRINITY_DN30238_c0_g1~~TRINITY_DN30238_c0_g1_i1.p1  ORF type:complete len:259 (+),score=44.69 TRINITY_DN30238_c0_g1_i1:40-816(+)
MPVTLHISISFSSHVCLEVDDGSTVGGLKAKIAEAADLKVSYDSITLTLEGTDIGADWERVQAQPLQDGSVLEVELSKKGKAEWELKQIGWNKKGPIDVIQQTQHHNDAESSEILELMEAVGLCKDEDTMCEVLHWAVEEGRHLSVSSLLQFGSVSVDAKYHGRWPLHVVANTDTLLVLLDHSPDLNAKNLSGWTPLHVAASCGFDRNVVMLLEAGADAMATSYIGETVYDIAARQGHSAVVAVLEERGIRHKNCVIA